MGWSGGFSTGGRVYVLTVAAFLVSFGFSSSASETTERELAFGSLDCPETLTVRLEKLLFRPPYLEREINSTNEFGGLFPGNVYVSSDLSVFRFQSVYSHAALS